MTAADRTALVLVPPAGDKRWVTGLGLGERARRVAARAGFTGDRAVLVSSADELKAARARLTGPLVLMRATDQVVAAPLLDGLALDQPGTRVAIDPVRGDSYAGALAVDADRAGALVDALIADFALGDDTIRKAWSDADAVAVGPRARHPAATAAEVKAATAWQWELVNKALDAPVARYFYRPLARPLTYLFLRSPLSPNVISLISIALSLGGCAIASGPSPTWHAIGLAILVAGGIVDCNDGEVARLRLEMSPAGAWLDAIGDDLSRLALICGLGLHLGHLYPDWPMVWIMGAALVMTVASLALIYWYCIFVIHSSNNQDYTRVLAIGPGVRPAGRRTVGAWLSDVGAQIVRRDIIDLGAAILAAVGLSEITFGLLSVGAVVTLAVVIPTHLKIVRSLRAKACADQLAVAPRPP